MTVPGDLGPASSWWKIVALLGPVPMVETIENASRPSAERSRARRLHARTRRARRNRVLSGVGSPIGYAALDGFVLNHASVITGKRPGSRCRPTAHTCSCSGAQCIATALRSGSRSRWRRMPVQWSRRTTRLPRSCLAYRTRRSKCCRAESIRLPRWRADASRCHCSCSRRRAPAR